MQCDDGCRVIIRPLTFCRKSLILLFLATSPMPTYEDQIIGEVLGLTGPVNAGPLGDGWPTGRLRSTECVCVQIYSNHGYTSIGLLIG